MTKKKAAVWIILFALMITGPRVVYYFAEPPYIRRKYGKQAACREAGADQNNLHNYAVPVQQLL